MTPATPAELAAQEPMLDDEPEGWEDDLLPLSHPSMQEAIARYWAIVNERDEIATLAKGQRAFNRSMK